MLGIPGSRARTRRTKTQTQSSQIRRPPKDCPPMQPRLRLPEPRNDDTSPTRKLSLDHEAVAEALAITLEARRRQEMKQRRDLSGPGTSRVAHATSSESSDHEVLRRARSKSRSRTPGGSRKSRGKVGRSTSRGSKSSKSNNSRGSKSRSRTPGGTRRRRVEAL